MRILFCLLFCLFISFLLSSSSFAQRADFFREDITFSLNRTNLDVDGYYWFTNHSEKTVESEIFYPFANYSNEKIDSIRLFNISKGEKVRFTKDENKGIYFRLNIAPHDTLLFQIGYRQTLSADSAVYILKTTQGWGKPIDLAEYKLVVPSSLPIKKFTYEPDRSYKIENSTVYYWKKEKFMPKEDMIFFF